MCLVERAETVQAVQSITPEPSRSSAALSARTLLSEGKAALATQVFLVTLACRAEMEVTEERGAVEKAVPSTTSALRESRALRLRLTRDPAQTEERAVPEARLPQGVAEAEAEETLALLEPAQCAMWVSSK